MMITKRFLSVNVLLLFALLFQSFAQENKTYTNLEAALQNREEVYKLSLRNKQLDKFPAEIIQFQNLIWLDLSINKISSLPPEIGKLMNLRSLNVSYNELSGLPPQIGDLSNLFMLGLSNNNLKTLPPEIGKLKKLTSIHLEKNPIQKLPAEIMNLENLKVPPKSYLAKYTPRVTPTLTVTKTVSATQAQQGDTRDGTSEIDYSFFTDEELKQMYKSAIDKKDNENTDLLKQELSKRSEERKAQETSQTMRGSGDPLKGLNVSTALNQSKIGNYFALIIGIDNYKGKWLPLKNAVKDAKAVENLLRAKYKIDNFRILHNELATRKNIMKELAWLVDNVNENDNVLIYYSGHGEYKHELNKGYWIPVEAQTTEAYELISNSDIQTYMNGIKSKHTILISDACFGGDIFRGNTITVPFEQTSNYYKKVYTLRSRQAFTSGGVNPVVNEGRQGHSIFTYYLLEMLRKNENKYYDAGQLYNDIKIPVTNNSDQPPLLQPVKNTGDEGGQFIFIKK